MDDTFLEEKNIKGIGAPISLTPQEQTGICPLLNKDNLTKLVYLQCSVLLKEQGGQLVPMIYSNSLSCAIDLEELHFNSPRIVYHSYSCL